MADKVFPELGVVHFTRKRNCRKIIGKIKQDGEIYISYPCLCSQSRAEKFVIDQAAWFIAHKQKQQTKHKLINESRRKFTHFHDLQIVQSNDTKLRITAQNKVISITVPCNVPIENPQIQQTIEETLQEILRKEAKYYLPQRTAELAKQWGFSYSKISIRSARTRWGSCNSHKNLMFSLFIMTLPYEHIDHIILHELCHTVHMNHSAEFYALLNTCCNGNLARLRKEHKKHEMNVFPKFSIDNE